MMNFIKEAAHVKPTKGVYHKNNASRKVSRLATAVNKMA